MHYHRNMTIPAWLPVTISSFSVALALAAFVWQVGRARFNQSVDLLFRLEADFFGPAKKAQRARAATDLLVGKSLEAEPILDFFETMALLLRRGALDEEIVWHTFFYWIDHYYAAACEHIEQRQVAEPLVWKDLVRLVTRLRRLQASKSADNRYTPPTPDQIASFLAEERTEAA
jgi:hypothetical protein